MDHRSSPAQAAAGSRGRVLVVDDSRVVRAVVARALRNAGYLVDDAADGASALRKIGQGSYDVVITDLKMPGLDGFGVLAAVKKKDVDVEVIILTGTHSDDMSCAVRALRLGAHDYLTKPPSSPDQIVFTVERAVEKKSLKDANRKLLAELQAQSRTDALTGIPNRRSFESALVQELARARRHGHALGLVLLDLDHFKKVNDSHGHQAGDQVLQHFARIAASTLRGGDALFRYGGEEFVALLPYADSRGAVIAAERILAAVAGSPIRVGAGLLSITCSAGVSNLGASTQDGADLIAQADAALYAAKAQGRNRVVADCSRPAPARLRLA